MSSEDRELTQEELEAQNGDPLPAREVMSLLTTNPSVGIVPLPDDPTLPADPPPKDDPGLGPEPDLPPPGYDV
jgi:hypothetical protein